MADSQNVREVKPGAEPFDPVPDERVLSLAREAQTRVDGSVGGASMIVDCYTLACLCAEVSLYRFQARANHGGEGDGDE